MTVGFLLSCGQQYALAQECPPDPEAGPPRLWRVHQITQAPIELPGATGTVSVPYFAKPYEASKLCTVAISDSLVVAGTYMKLNSTGSPIPRPFVWLHDPQYGFAAGFHDLLDLTPESDGDEPGYANDISDTGVVVGGRGGLIEEPSLYAYAWSLSGYSGGGSGAIPLDTAGNTAISWSIATAIEKFTTFGQPGIVGTVGNPVCINHWWAARFSLTSMTPTVLSSLPQPDDSSIGQVPDLALRFHFTDVAYGEGEALDVDTPGDAPVQGQACLPPLLIQDDCEMDFIVGAEVVPGFGPIWLRIGPYDYPNGDPVETPVSKRITSARSVASDGLVGGCMQKYVGFGNCVTIPAVWDNPQPPEVPEVQPNLPFPQGLVEAQIEAVGEPSDCGLRRLTGWSPSSFEGVVWDSCPGSGSPPDWCTYRINDLSGNSIASVAQAFDLNGVGHIAAVVNGWSESGTPQRFVGVLGHRSDLDFNFTVDATDLAILLGAWGASNAYVIAGADIDDDGGVGAADLAILLGDWASPVALQWPCSGVGCTMLAEMQAASVAVGNSEIESAMQAVGFASRLDFTEWCATSEPEQVLSAGQLILAMLSSQQGGEQ